MKIIIKEGQLYLAEMDNRDKIEIRCDKDINMLDLTATEDAYKDGWVAYDKLESVTLDDGIEFVDRYGKLVKK